MSKNRINRTVPAIRTRESLEATVGEVALHLARQQKLTAELNRRVTEIRQGYEAEQGELAQLIDAKTEAIQEWAEANPDEFGALRSLELTHAVIGWRTGQPALKPVTGWTWDRVLEKVLALGGVWDGYVRTTREIDKQALLADRESYSEADLKKIGVRVVQATRFFVEPKIETVETVVKGEAA